MAKKIHTYVKLQVPAGKANPSPPVGPALGQQGVNIMEFCKRFNTETQNEEPGIPIPVVITVYADKSFSFVKKTPPVAVLLRKAAGIGKGSGTPNSQKVGGVVSREKLEDIAKIKMADLNITDGEPTDADIEAAVRTIVGSARSAGIEVAQEVAQEVVQEVVQNVP